jgi:hypothetical protein
MIALEKNDELRWIRRDPQFVTFVIDHDESLEDAWERMNVVRKHTEDSR